VTGDTLLVLVESPDEDCVMHELNAYADGPNRMIGTCSELHMNILDSIGKKGIGIVSPLGLGVRQ